MDSTDPFSKMIYRYLGDSGLKVSVLGFGNWITGHDLKEEETQIECIKKAFEYGVNFFDTAEIYGAGNAETIMGKAIKEIACPRKDLVVTTKIFKCGDGINDMFLSRKHIRESLENSLKRLDLEYVDVVFCHRPDDDTPLEETIKAMNSLIEDGLAFYWATSEWPPEKISQCMEICKRLKLIRPIADQCQYSALVRENFEKNLRTAYEDYKYGTTIWSPLAGGILTGKYNDGIVKDGTRYKDNELAANVIWQKFFGDDTKEKTLESLKNLQAIADDKGCTMAQLALAWALVNQDVSTCIFGASKLSQLEDNMKSLQIAIDWDADLEAKVNEALNNEPTTVMDFNTWAPRVSRRSARVDYKMAIKPYVPMVEGFQKSTTDKAAKK